MEIFRDTNGYAPLNENLEAYFEKPFGELPDEIKEIIEGSFLSKNWDSCGVEERRSSAVQHDYQHDPKHEPALYWQLINVLLPELIEKIEEAKRDKKSRAKSDLQDVETLVQKIINLDRSGVGAKIQHEREELEKSLDEISTENGRLRDRIWEGFDESDPKYPRELDIAMQAWRAASLAPVSGPPKEFIKDWLGRNYRDLSDAQRERIATVANWHKQGGRPPSTQE